MNFLRRLMDAWHAVECPYCAQRQPSSMWENDPDIEVYWDLNHVPLQDSPHAQKLQELLNRLKDPLEEIWERPCLIDLQNPELREEV